MRTAAILLVCALLSEAAYAQESSTEAQYTAYYGDGIRAYAEARYDDALTNLYRAMAVRPNPFALKLIIRVHDFQGNCTARHNASTMLTDFFPSESAPPTQRCSEVGELMIQCAPDSGTVRVDDAFDAACNAPLLVPAGPHRLESSKIGAAVQVEVRAEERTVASLTMRPGKWYLDVEHRQVVELPKRWLRPGLLDDPDMPRTFQWKRP